MALFAPMQNIDALHFYVHKANIKLYHSLQNNSSIEGLILFLKTTKSRAIIRDLEVVSKVHLELRLFHTDKKNCI